MLPAEKIEQEAVALAVDPLEQVGKVARRRGERAQRLGAERAEQALLGLLVGGHREQFRKVAGTPHEIDEAHPEGLDEVRAVRRIKGAGHEKESLGAADHLREVRAQLIDQPARAAAAAPVDPCCRTHPSHPLFEGFVIGLAKRSRSCQQHPG